MSRYIDPDLLKAEFAGDFTKAYATPLIKRIIDQQPTADVVEVVRCKNCQYFVSEICRHDLAMNLSRSDNFCSYGERRKEDVDA